MMCMSSLGESSNSQFAFQFRLGWNLAEDSLHHDGSAADAFSIRHGTFSRACCCGRKIAFPFNRELVLLCLVVRFRANFSVSINSNLDTTCLWCPNLLAIITTRARSSIVCTNLKPRSSAISLRGGKAHTLSSMAAHFFLLVVPN